MRFVGRPVSYFQSVQQLNSAFLNTDPANLASALQDPTNTRPQWAVRALVMYRNKQLLAEKGQKEFVEY